MKIPSVAIVPQARRQSSCSNGYLITIVYNKIQFISSEDLLNRLKLLKKQLLKYGAEWSSFIGIELKGNNVLHLHTYASFIRSPWVKHSNPFNIQLKRITKGDEQRVISYILKDDPSACAIQQRETLSNHYLTNINQLYQD